MAGLSILLDYQKGGSGSGGSTSSSNKKTQVINKASMMIKASPPLSSPSPLSPGWIGSQATTLSPTASFLDACFLCRQKLLPGKDIYMYKGDRAFCSEDCRWRQILMDEEESSTAMRRRNRSAAAADQRPNCSWAAINMTHPKHTATNSPSTTSSSSKSRHHRHRSREPSKQAADAGWFAY
ncbi:hypothetical protein Ancab_013597 [Ancistrocladus abbreviatus]